MVKAVLFDLGDTLINYAQVDAVAMFNEGAALAYDYLRQQGHGDALPSLDYYTSRQRRAVKLHYAWSWLTNRDFNAMDLLGCLHRKMGLPHDVATMRVLNDLFYQPLGEHSQVEPGAHAMLAGLREKGLSLAIVSNTFVPGHTLDAHLARVGLLEFFPVRLYSCDTIYRKPHRRIFEMAAEAVGASFDQCVFVGDRPEADVKGANRVGMISVLKRVRPAEGRWRPRHHVQRLADELPAIVESYR